MQTSSTTPGQADVLDPVCGMTIDPAQAAGTYDYKGQRYYFCNPSCLARFQADPEAFLAPKGDAAPAPAPKGVTYICPMDPEVRQDEPGPCPICGDDVPSLNIACGLWARGLHQRFDLYMSRRFARRAIPT